LYAKEWELARSPINASATISSARAPSQQLRSLPSSVGIAVECLDGTFAFYRVREGRLEKIEGGERDWSQVPPEDILQHLVLRTPVGIWLESRVVLRPAEWVKPYFHAG